jgi:hypothetical protein
LSAGDPQTIMATNWIALLLAAATGGLAATLISAFAKYCIFHPVISVRLDAKKGSYVKTWFFLPSEAKAVVNSLLDLAGPVPGASEVRYLRLHVENTGRSTIKSCSGYITQMTKRASGIESISKQEVVALVPKPKVRKTLDTTDQGSSLLSATASDTN